MQPKILTEYINYEDNCIPSKTLRNLDIGVKGKEDSCLVGWRVEKSLSTIKGLRKRHTPSYRYSERYLGKP